ncbi:MAG: choice-of-anchor tandem repeat GloVer-containing protein [Terriglobales bacterium]
MDSGNKDIALGKSSDVSHFSWKPTLAVLTFVCVFLLVAVRSAQAQSETVLYSFLGEPDGANPVTAVTLDAAGNLYGTTDNGGTAGLGTVFKLAPDGKETVLYSFAVQADGANPFAGLVRGKKGYLYGATLYNSDSYGTLYKVSPKGVHTVLYAFTGGADGADPYGENLILDKAGNLYGTGYSGGTFEYGVVFELSAAGTESVLYSFTGGTDGGRPYAGVVEDKHGNFYGTTLQGGAFGLGTVYKVTASGTETVLHSFAGGSDGATPYGGVILDSKGNLYGTTAGGGSSNAGIVFKLSPSGTETVLYAFAGGPDGANPTVALVRDKAGNLYGTTYNGGNGNGSGDGTVFEISPSGTHTVLHTFTGGADGAVPDAGLILDKHGNLYGTTLGGGIGFGVVYELTP